MNQAISDTRLLDQWRMQRDPDAFAELVARYGPLVFSACLRVLGERTSAEDAAQECFVELLRSRSRVRSLPAWLHVTATRRALDRLKADHRRAERESRYAAEHPEASEPTWDDVSVHVDEAIAALPEKLRAPLVQRFLQGRNYQEISRDLTLPVSTVQYRLHQGIERVRRELARRGITVAGAALGVMLSEAKAQALPTAAAACLGKMALAGGGATATTGAVAAGTALGGVLAMNKVAVGVAIAIGALLTTGYVISRKAPDTRRPAAAAVMPSEDAEREVVLGPAVPEATPAETEPVAVKAEPADSPDVVVSGTVVDSTGKYVPGAVVEATWTGGAGSVTADERGWFQFSFSTDFTVDGPLVFRRDLFYQGEPTTVVFSGRTTGDTLTGMIDGERAQVTGTRVGHGSGAIGSWKTVVELGNEKIEGTLVISATETGGVSGEWRDAFKPSAIAVLSVPERMTLSAALDHLKAFPEVFDIPSTGRKDILIAMERTASVAGRVIDSQGEPLAEWQVLASGDESREVADTDERGEFTIRGLMPGDYKLVALDPTKTARAEWEKGPLTLRPGEHVQGLEIVWRRGPLSVTGHVVGQDGQPIPGAEVRAWYSPEVGATGDTHFAAQADESGRYTVAGFPELDDLDVNFQVGCESFMQASRYGVRLDGQEVDFVLAKKPRIELRVLDAASGEPITRYRVHRWYGTLIDESGSILNTSRMEVKDHPNGEYSMLAEGYGLVNIAVSAPGYATAVIEVPNVKPGDNVKGVEIRLNPAKPLQGVVVDSSGAPVAEARIYLGYPLLLGTGIAVGSQGITRTDQSGHFAVTEYPPSLSLVSAYHPRYAPSWTNVAAPEKPLRITLSTGATIEGRVTYGGVPIDDQRAHVNLEVGGDAVLQARSGDGGTYVIERAPTGLVTVYAGFHEGGVGRYIHREIELHDGASIRVDFEFSDADDSYAQGVLLLDDRPLPLALLRAMVEAENGDVVYYQTETRGDGSYTLGPIPATTFEFGALWILMEDGSYLEPDSETVTTRAGETTRYDILLSSR